MTPCGILDVHVCNTLCYVGIWLWLCASSDDTQKASMSHKTLSHKKPPQPTSGSPTV